MIFSKFDLFNVVFLSTLIIFVPLATNLDIGAKGWELPKVYLSFFAITIYIFISLVYFVKKYSIRGIFYKIKNNYKNFALFLLAIFSISFGSLISNSSYQLPDKLVFNPLIKLLYQDKTILATAIWGNQYREMGLLLILLLIFFGVFLALNFKKKNIKYIVFAFIVSAVLQVIISIIGYILLFSNFINDYQFFGTFGQNNFFSGHLLIGLLASMYFFNSKSNLISRFAGISFGIISIGLILSQSYWAIAIAGIILIYLFWKTNKSNKEVFKGQYKFFILFLLLFNPIILTISILIPYFSQRYYIWTYIFKETFLNFFSNPSLQLFLVLFFGNGFDTLQDLLFGITFFGENIIDRAHNIFLDIFTFTGLFGLLIFIFLLYYLWKRTNKNINKLSVLFFSLTLIWIIRSMLHTYSIYNLVQFVVILSLLFVATSNNLLNKNTNEKSKIN